MKFKILATAGVVAVAAAALTGCAPTADSGSSAGASCTNKIVNTEATQVSVWAWYPAFEEVVDLFTGIYRDGLDALVKTLGG